MKIKLDIPTFINLLETEEFDEVQSLVIATVKNLHLELREKDNTDYSDFSVLNDLLGESEDKVIKSMSFYDIFQNVRNINRFIDPLRLWDDRDIYIECSEYPNHPLLSITDKRNILSVGAEYVNYTIFTKLFNILLLNLIHNKLFQQVIKPNKRANFKIVAEPLPKNTFGVFNPAGNYIRIDVNKPGIYILHTLLHEINHAVSFYKSQKNIDPNIDKNAAYFSTIKAQSARYEDDIPWDERDEELQAEIWSALKTHPSFIAHYLQRRINPDTLLKILTNDIRLLRKHVAAIIDINFVTKLSNELGLGIFPNEKTLPIIREIVTDYVINNRLLLKDNILNPLTKYNKTAVSSDKWYHDADFDDEY